ncbi:MAG: DUF6328 family protein [Microthrixaceae bacterium]
MSGEGGQERSPDPGEDDRAELPSSALDDERDRDELRNRYQMLLQEARVIVTGTQVLLAFLLTVPFTQRFGELDSRERSAFGVALVAALLSVICLMAPVVFHRVGDRQARSSRLRLGIQTATAGVGFLAIALISALWSVTRFVFGASVALSIAIGAIASLVGLWVLVPLMSVRSTRSGS